MRREILFAWTILLIAALACGAGNPTPLPPLESSVFDEGRTVYGFFPSAPEATLQSVTDTYKAIGEHADVVLLQQNIPWEEFVQGVDVESQDIIDMRNQVILARQNKLEIIFVVDPLNGLNRRKFLGLPDGWEANFANPDVRTAFKNYTLRIVQEIHPRYLGLASEINTYADAHPEDFENYLSLYREVYTAVKAIAPETQVFVTFQWEDLNNLMPTATEGRTAYDINWDQIEAFEPQLDLWVISSYPFAVFRSAADIPADYYTPLLTQTRKPLAVAEGGFTSETVGPFTGTPEDQVGYLNAIHTQIGPRLSFWIYLLISDFDLKAYADYMRKLGVKDVDINTLGLFASVGLRKMDGTPKPALAVWDGFRKDSK
jgi:hypothetical protein